jgi:O-acetylhomoserine (thiol)-lyase
MGKLFDLEASGYFYSRLQNPTCDMVAAQICALECGAAAMLTSSGQAANFYAIFNIANCGDHVVASSTIYGGTFNLFAVTMKKMGIEFTFVRPEATTEAIEAAIRPNTKAIFGEVLANPELVVLDIERMADIAHRHGLPLIVDNTFPTPYLCRPFQFGADIVTHSTTKYLDGHATSVGGVIVEKGGFNWSNGKFPELCTPDISYHGLVYTENFAACPYSAKMRAQWIRDLGTPQMPFNAFLTMLGCETLHLRMERHSENAQKLAEFLLAHPKVSWVKYPGLPGDSQHEMAKKYLKGCSGVLSFGVKGGKAAGEIVMDNLKLAAIAVHVADVRTCVLHPASMTHRQLSEEELIAAGVSADLIRVSVGIENIDDIKADFEQALALV